MLKYLLDTEHLSLLDRGHAALQTRLDNEQAGTVGVSAVTVEEALWGRVNNLRRAPDGAARIRRYHYLLGTFNLLLKFPQVPYDQASEDEFQRLLALRTGVGVQDLKIAAVALVNNLTVLTRNRRDFARVPGLVIDDWSV
jgi:tRNA(fMet)-specific endonuclease VapC